MSEVKETPFSKLRNILSPAKNLAEIVSDYRRPSTSDKRWDELMNEEAIKSKSNFDEILSIIDLLEKKDAILGTYVTNIGLDRSLHLRRIAVEVFELTKGFTPEQRELFDTTFQTMEELAGYVLELTNLLDISRENKKPQNESGAR